MFESSVNKSGKNTVQTTLIVTGLVSLGLLLFALFRPSFVFFFPIKNSADAFAVSSLSFFVTISFWLLGLDALIVLASKLPETKKDKLSWQLSSGILLLIVFVTAGVAVMAISSNNIRDNHLKEVCAGAHYSPSDKVNLRGEYCYNNGGLPELSPASAR